MARKGNRSLLEISQNLRSIHNGDVSNRSRSHDPAAVSDETNRKLKNRDVDIVRRSKSISAADKKKASIVISRKKSDKENSVSCNGNDSFSNTTSKGSERQVRFDEDSVESNSPRAINTSTPTVNSQVYNSDGHHYIVRNISKTNDNVLHSVPNEKLRKTEAIENSRKRKSNVLTHQGRLKLSRDKAKLWAETNSDPGQNTKSIHNDSIIKGRPVDPRRGRVANDGPRSKHSQFINSSTNGGPRAEARPKGADRGRRQQSNPVRRDGTEAADERSINSAPAKEQAPPGVPMPKINNLVTSGNDSPAKSTKIVTEDVDKASKPNDTKIISKTDSKEPPGKEVKTENKVRQKSESHHQDAAGTSTQEQDAKRSSKFTSPATNTPNQEQPKQKNDAKTTLPPDDHGAVAKTTKINAEKEEKPENKSPTKPQTDLKYYASEAQKKSMAEEAEKKEKTYIPSLKLQTEKTTKTDKTSTSNTKKEQTAHESPRKSERSKTVEISRTPTTDYSDGSRKRKEVTIIDPAEVRKVKYMDGDEEDTFPKEFEYREPGERRTKKFEEMTDEEKVDYFRHQLKIRPDQIRELTFHPKVTAPKQIHRAYTGVDTVGWASSPRQLSARRPKSRYNKGVYKKVQSVLPHKRKSFMFSRLQGVVYRHINNVYGQSPRENREKQFLEKLAQVQIEEYERRYQMLEQRERKRLESKFKQREQLKQLRRRFEDDAWRRFMTQYVTSKVVEAEYSNRHEYGLPNDLNERKSNFHQRRRRGFVLTPKRRTRVNQKKYSTIFNFNAGPEWKVGGKPMKFEGFDTVEIEMEDENGKPVKRTQNVDDLMREAKRLLDQSDDEYTDIEDEPQTTPRREVPRRRQARPSHGRSRTNSDRSRSKERKKTQSKPPPKTMKELYERKNVMLPQQNRYRVSEFKDIKADLLKGSAELNRIAEAKKKRANLDKNNKNDVEPAQPAKGETDNQKPSNNMKTPPPSPDAKKILPEKDERGVKVTSTTTSNVVSETTNVTKAQTVKSDTKDEVRNTSVETKNYLDDPETQMAIENAKDKPVDDRKSPAKSEATETKDDKGSQQFKEKPKTSGLNKNDVSTSRVSLANAASNQNGHQRRMSKTSLVITNGTHNRQNESPQRRASKTTVVTTIETQNNDYQQSKASLTSVNTANDGSDKLDGSQRRVIPTEVKSDTQKDVERKSVAGSRVTLRDQKVIHTIQNGDIKSEHSENTVTQNGTKSPNNNTVSKTEEMVEVKTITSDKDKANNGPTVNGTVTNSNSITVETNSKNKTVRKTDEPPKMNGHMSPSSDKQRRNSVVISSSNVPSVMKSVHVSENVTEKVNNKTIKSQNNKTRHQKGRIIARKSVENDPSLITQQMSYNDKNRTNILKSTTRNKESPSRGKHDASQPRSRSHTPNRSRKTSNPKHSDSRMSREDYERKGSKTRQRDRKRSTSRERKRSVSRERKHSQQQTSKSRFPEIEKRDGRISVVPFSEPKSERKVSVKEEEDTQEIEISSSKPAGAKQWKDLVSKYLRQPSPKVGKTEDRKLLETNLDTDDDDDEIDIFERAKKRYLLNVSDDDSEDE